MTTRRQLIALTAGLLPLAPLTAEADAAAPISKAQVGYQDVPRNGQVCAQCVYFIFKPATSSAPASRCKMVAGPISPAGWCQIWAPAAK
jgi:hypothetical protein